MVCAEMHHPCSIFSPPCGDSGLRSSPSGAIPRRRHFLLLSGTAFYWATEDWSLIQSLYFSVVTLTTVG